MRILIDRIVSWYTTVLWSISEMVLIELNGFWWEKLSLLDKWFWDCIFYTCLQRKRGFIFRKLTKEMGKCTAWCWLSANCNISHYCPGFPLWLRYLAIMRLLMYDCWPMTPIIPGDKSHRPHNHPDSQRIKTWGSLLDHNKCQDLCSFPIFGGILTRKAPAETKAEQ